MLRPATPLTVLLLVAFALLLLTVLSAPVVKSFPLGSFQDVTFGFLGYCTANGCSDFNLGYGNIGKLLLVQVEIGWVLACRDVPYTSSGCTWYRTRG